MTVHRVGPASHRTGLGRVLITIDDLSELMKLLTRSTVGVAANIHVEFDGGYFTDAEDLRTLSDMELKSLRLKTPKVEVALSRSAAFAVGDQQEADDVYRMWARARQTRLRSRAVGWVDFLVLGIAISASLGLAIELFRIYFPGPVLYEPFHSFIFVGLLGGITGAFLSGIVLTIQSRIMPSSYAIIIPSSLKEYRENRSNQMYPRRSWIVAIVAAIIAAAAVGVAIWAVLSR